MLHIIVLRINMKKKIDTGEGEEHIILFLTRAKNFSVAFENFSFAFEFTIQRAVLNMTTQKEAACKVEDLLRELKKLQADEDLNMQFKLPDVSFKDMNSTILSFVFCLVVQNFQVFFRVGSEIGSVTSYIFSQLDLATMEILPEVEYEYFDNAEDVVQKVVSIVDALEKTKRTKNHFFTNLRANAYVFIPGNTEHKINKTTR